MTKYIGGFLTEVGLNRTSRPVRKSDKFSKSGLSGNQTFSFPDAGLLKIEKKNFKKNFQFFFHNLYFLLIYMVKCLKV